MSIISIIQAAAFSSMMSSQMSALTTQIAWSGSKSRSRTSSVSSYHQPAKLDPIAEQPKYIAAVASVTQAQFDAAKPGDIIGGSGIL